jgi:hypothetical protein
MAFNDYDNEDSKIHDKLKQKTWNEIRILRIGRKNGIQNK